MGIQDRDYYREDEPTWWAGTVNLRVTYALMVLVGVVFVMQVLGSNPERNRPDRLLPALDFRLDALAGGEVWRLVTPYVVHGRDGLLLVGLAIWAFYYFGRRVEAALGTVEYATFLVATTLVISLVKLAVAALTGFEAGLHSFGSGPLLAAVLVLHVCRFPHLRISFIVSMPAAVLAAAVVGFEVLGEFGGGFAMSGKVAYPAAAGWALAYFKLNVPVARVLRLDRLFGVTAGRRKSSLKLFRSPAESPQDRDAATDRAARDILATDTRSAPAVPASASVDEQLEAKLDQVLEKVSRSGRDSLTSDEQNILRRASEIYKQRRGT